MARVFRNKKRRIKKTGQSLASKVAKIQKQLTVQKPELKWYNKTGSAQATSTSGTIQSLVSGILQGDSDFGYRDGDSINLKSLNIRLAFTSNGLSDITYRVILFQMKNNPDNLLGLNNVLNSIMLTTNLGTAVAPLVPYDKDNYGSYRVFYDEMHTVDNNGVYFNAVVQYTSALKNVQIRHTFKPSEQKVNFLAAGSTVTKNDVFLLIISDAAGVHNYDVSLYYTDA